MYRRSCFQSGANRCELDRRQGRTPSTAVGGYPYCRSVQCTGLRPGEPPSSKRASGDGRQVSGPASTGSHLLSDDLVAGGRPAWNGISLQLKSAQCRDVARSGRSDCGRQPSSSGARVPQPAANAVGKCPLPLRRNRPRDAIIGAKRRVPLLIQRDIFL